MTSGWGSRQRIGLVAGAALFVAVLALPAPAGLGLAAWKTTAVAVLMAAWWMTEALPIPVTSLLPILLFPLLGILPIRDATAPYAHPLIFLFLGGFLIALTMEASGLHRRLALGIIRRVGTEPRRIVLGFLLAAAALSMWISNTATSLMMLPIGLSVVALGRSPSGRERPQNREPDQKPDSDPFALCLMLAIAYGASVGGVATLVGTPTNALLAAFAADSLGLELSFARWMLLAAPVSAVGLAVVYFVLTRWAYPITERSLPGGRALIERETAALGPWTPAERRVGGIFLLTAALWIGRPVLQGLFPTVLEGLSDPGIAILGALLCFAVPVDFRRGEFLLRWDDTRRLPWGVLLLFGGGLSLAAAIQSTGLAEALGRSMSGLESWPVAGLVLATVLLVIFLTELTSNTATAAAFLPVLASLAAGLGLAPMTLLVPATLAASCAFMLPVATPPNAIVYGSGEITIPQMVRAGWALNLLFAVFLTAVAVLVGPVVF